MPMHSSGREERFECQCSTMSKNEPLKDDDDLSVCCQSGLSDLDLDSCNQKKEQAGEYLLANLLEIHLSFQHYRCETFANYLDGPFRLSGPSRSSTQCNLGPAARSEPPEAAALQRHSSLPSSPATEQSDTYPLLPDCKSHSKARAHIRSRDYRLLLSRIARFTKPSLGFASAGPKSRCLLKSSPRKSSDKSGELSLGSPGASAERCILAATVEGRLFGEAKHVPSQRCAHFGDAASGIAESTCSFAATATGRSMQGGPPCSPSFEIPSGPSTSPVNLSPEYSTSSHLTVPVGADEIANTQLKNSSCQSFCLFSASSSSSSLPKAVTRQILPRLPLTKNSPLDFRSISEYSFTANSISHCIKADVCSLPIHMDDELSSKMLDPKPHFGDSTRRMPSYVSISRAISGYSNYNKYSSDLRRDNSLLDSLLASRTPSRANGQHGHAQVDRGGTPLVDDQVDNFCSLPYELTQEKVFFPDSSSKSFLQKKIESLYGQTFAEDWSKSRLVRSNSPKQNTQPEKTRSPSCPPSRIASKDAPNQCIPFPKLNSLDNSRENVHFNKSASGQSDSKDEESKRTEQEADHSFPARTAPQDGPWFLGLLKDCKAGIQLHIDRYEAVLAASEISSEENIGKIRATIGKANLLMNKKLNQFNKLCQDSIVQDEEQEFKIKPDDLQGFWDMVTIQVEEVNGAFKELDQLRQNNWIPTIDDETAQKAAQRKLSHSKHNTSSPRSVSKLVSPTNSPKTSKTASPNGLDRETERKLRLLEIKKKGKLKAKEKAEEEITIFLPATEDVDLEKEDKSKVDSAHLL